MIKLILLAITAIGSVAALVHWLLKRWYGRASEIANLKGKVDEITCLIIDLEKLHPHTYSRLARIKHLKNERMRLNRRIRYLSGTQQGDS